MTFSLENRTAVVTGAASGIGAAIATRLGARGARVALLARRYDRLEALAADLKDGIAVRADVTDAASVAAAADAVHRAFGPVDLVVNAAGVMLPNPVTAARTDEWERMIATNFAGVLRVSGAFVPDLIAAASDGRTADLVTVSSIGAHVTFPDYAVYGATKAAVTHLAASLRTELGPRDVRVTNIEPGLTDTELGGHIDNPTLAGQLAGMFDALGGLDPLDVADVVEFVVSRPRHVNLRQVVMLPTRQA